jgi:hypothetical protein
MEFEFSFNFKKIFDNITKNGMDYFKTDLRYIIYFMIGIIGSFFLYQ